jgi:hypothetical protein
MNTISRIVILIATIILLTGCTMPGQDEPDPEQTPWSTPVEVGAAGGSITWKRLATNNEGEAILTWQYQTSGEGKDLKLFSGNNWGDEISLGADLNSDPAIAINEDGNAFVGWLRAEGDYLQVWARRYVKGAGWSQDALIDVTECVTENYHQIMIAADSQGTAVLIWGQPLCRCLGLE